MPALAREVILTLTQQGQATVEAIDALDARLHAWHREQPDMRIASGWRRQASGAIAAVVTEGRSPAKQGRVCARKRVVVHYHMADIASLLCNDNSVTLC